MLIICEKVFFGDQQLSLNEALLATHSVHQQIFEQLFLKRVFFTLPKVRKAQSLQSNTKGFKEVKMMAS
jgi:hypothetical protein